MSKPGHQGASENKERFIPITISIAITTPINASPATSPAVISSPVLIVFSFGDIPVCLIANSQSLISSSYALPNFFMSNLSVRYRIIPPANIGTDSVKGR